MKLYNNNLRLEGSSFMYNYFVYKSGKNGKMLDTIYHIKIDIKWDYEITN